MKASSGQGREDGQRRSVAMPWEETPSYDDLARTGRLRACRRYWRRTCRILVELYGILESTRRKGLPTLMLCSFSSTGVQGSRTGTRGDQGSCSCKHSTPYAKKLHYNMISLWVERDFIWQAILVVGVIESRSVEFR